jgi:hypothetical protein
VEETGSCGYVSDRSMPVNGGTENDVVANWAAPGACGDSGAVINVTVPSDTPSGHTVYLSGNYNVLGTGIPAYDDQTGPDTWTLTITGVPVADFQYKFTLGSWSSVEETASCGYVSNRTFDFSTADETYTASDTVAVWGKESAPVSDLGHTDWLGGQRPVQRPQSRGDRGARRSGRSSVGPASRLPIRMLTQRV